MIKSIKDEFIGSHVRIESSRNKGLEGLEGKIIDETKNSFTIRVDEKEKIILKKDVVFRIEGKIIDGNRIIKRTEDRIKLKGQD